MSRFVDDQIVEGDLLVDRFDIHGVAADDECGILMFRGDILGVGITAPTACAIFIGDKVFVLVESIG